MKKTLLYLLFTSILSTFTIAQTTLIGAETYSVTIPNNFTRTTGNNDLATVQWENIENEIYGYVFFEHKDELSLKEVNSDIENYANLTMETYKELKDFKLLDSKKYKTSQGIETSQREFKYYDEVNEIKFHMFLNIFKSNNFIYLMMNYGEESNMKNQKKDINFVINNFKI